MVYCRTWDPPLPLHPTNWWKKKRTSYYRHIRVFTWVSESTDDKVGIHNDARHTLLVCGNQICTYQPMQFPNCSHRSCPCNICKLDNSWFLSNSTYHRSTKPTQNNRTVAKTIYNTLPCNHFQGWPWSIQGDHFQGWLQTIDTSNSQGAASGNQLQGWPGKIASCTR